MLWNPRPPQFPNESALFTGTAFLSVLQCGTETLMPQVTERSSSAVESVLRACSILRAFRFEGELLRLRDIVTRTSLRKTTVHRLLHTLEKAGFVQRVGAESYGCRIKPVEHKR